MPTPAQIARSVREQARAAVVGQVGVTEGRILTSFEPIIRRLRRRLHTATPFEVQALVDAAARELAAAAAQQIAQGINATSLVGVQASQTQHERLTGEGGPMHHPDAAAISSRIGEQQRRALVEARIQGRFVRDRIPLSSRLYRRMNEVAHSATVVVRSGIEAREGVFRVAENFIAENRQNINVEVPQYVTQLIAAARRSIDTGDRSVLLEAIAEHQQYMDRLGNGAQRRDGQTSLRSAVRQFVVDLQRATPQNIDKIVQRHLEDRAQYQARRIARSEMAEAHRQAYRASIDENPYVVGYRWVLSPTHPRPDVCDVLANQDTDGLGPGGYAKGSYPETPHANCLCQPESIQDEFYFRRKAAIRDGLEEPPRPWERDTHQTAEEWLASRPESFQRALLGPTRTEILRDPSDTRRVVDARGVPIPVGQITGANTSRRPTATTSLTSGLR